MPRFNRTGPFGLGPGTGWGLGPCMGGRFMGRGRGYGWGYGPFMPEITKQEEKELLKQESDILEDELNAVKERLSELKGKK